MTKQLSKRFLIEYMYEQYKESEYWLSSIPKDIADAFFDNTYVKCRGRINLALLQYVFTEEELDWVDWLVLEWDYNPNLTISVDNVTYMFKTFEEGLNMIFELGLIKEDINE